MTRKIKQYRFFSEKSRARLTRAKRLYVYHARQAIALDRSGTTLQYCASRMISAGIANCSHNDCKYLILRLMWKYDSPFKMKWHEWSEKNGWIPYPWRRNK